VGGWEGKGKGEREKEVACSYLGGDLTGAETEHAHERESSEALS
jgi:hypothetical protein